MADEQNWERLVRLLRDDKCVGRYDLMADAAKTIEKLVGYLNQYEASLQRHEALVKAVDQLYFAGYWHADRQVDEVALWTAVRDAAGIGPGQTNERLGPDRTRPEGSVAQRVIDAIATYGGQVASADGRGWCIQIGGNGVDTDDPDFEAVAKSILERAPQEQEGK